MSDPSTPPEAETPEAETPEQRRSRTARAKAQAEQFKARADQKVKEYEAKRPSSRVIDAAFATFERDTSNGGGVLAAAMAFRIFIFLVPFVFVVVTAVPVAAESADTDPVKLAKNFGMAGLASTAIKSAADLPFWQRMALLIVGIIALVLASRSLVRVLRITHGLAWNARVQKLQKPTRAAVVLIFVVLALVSFGALSGKLFGDFGVIGLLPHILGFAVFVGLWVFVTDHLPRADGVTWKEQIPGAILVATGAEVLQLVTIVWFTRSIESKSETYGAIGAALAMLLWAYFLGRIFVSGAMLNAVLWEQDQRERAAKRARRAPPPTSPIPQENSAPTRPEEHEEPRRQQGHDDAFDVEMEVAVVREKDQNAAAKQHRGNDSEENSSGDPRHRAHADIGHGRDRSDPASDDLA